MSRPVIVIGAARSGTKLMRSVIATHDSFVEVPHDMNYVWKFGNYAHASDELTPGDLDERTRSFIRQHMERRIPRGDRRGSRTSFVEKTVGNSLRVAFVKAVYPEALLVHLIRDGRDVAESARRMWRQPMNWSHVRAKLPEFPLRAVPRYAVNYLRSYAARRTSSERRVASWGPVFEGMGEFASSHSLLETCAMQWKRCVEASRRDLAQLDPMDVVEVRYEDLVREPESQIRKVGSRLGIEYDTDAVERIRRKIRPGSIGKWRKALDSDEQKEVSGVCGPLLDSLGYRALEPG